MSLWWSRRSFDPARIAYRPTTRILHPLVARFSERSGQREDVSSVANVLQKGSFGGWRRRPGNRWETTVTSGEAAAAGPISLSPVRRRSLTTALPLHDAYRYLQLQSFSKDELGVVFDQIRLSPDISTDSRDGAKEVAGEIPSATLLSSAQSTDADEEEEKDRIQLSKMRNFFYHRIKELEREKQGNGVINEDASTPTDLMRIQYASDQAESFWLHFTSHGQVVSQIQRTDFVDTLHHKASQVDLHRTWPITASMLLVGSSVGIITPAMPFVVELLGLTAGQYGMVVSAFALSKMAGNIPSAVLVERHGRKPYMSYSLALIAVGVGGIGLANSFEALYLCRFLTGAGVAALSTAGTMMIADLSTPLNRASTMAPIMSAFAAGTALGPALGGYLVDVVGLHNTFYLVGVSYLGVFAVNQTILQETQPKAMSFPWQSRTNNASLEKSEQESFQTAVQKAIQQWIPLLKDTALRNVLIMNGMYWVALAGSQMTLLPLILTDASSATSLAMSATQVGQVYMGMSLVQIVGNPIFAQFVDRLGKAPAIVGGCALISASMAVLPSCSDLPQLGATLCIWSMGSSMLSTAPIAFVSDQVAPDKRAQAIALLRTCGDVGFLVGAAATGAVANWVGLDNAMHSSAALLMTSTAWFATRLVMSAKIKAASTKAE